MRSLIVYYSRTGTTGKLAAALAEALDAQTCEIACARYRPGALRYLKAGYDSLKGNLPAIDVPDIDAAQYDLLVLGAPVWTSYPALPLRAYLARKSALPAHVGAFFTSGGHSPATAAIEGVTGALARPLDATLALKASEVDGPGLAAAIGPFVQQLKAACAH